MDSLYFSAERSAIRFAIDGEWTAEEFAAFLRDTSEVYERINSLFVLRRAIDAESRFNDEAREQKNYSGQVFTWHTEFFGRLPHRPMDTFVIQPPSYERLLYLTRSVSQPLQVDAISYASPGWIQLIGDLNPLKVLSEFITNWRAENTKRDANVMKYGNERVRIQAELVAKLLEAAPKMESYYEGSTSRLIDMAESVINPATAYSQRIGNDSRIVDAEMTRPGNPLPPPKLSP